MDQGALSGPVLRRLNLLALAALLAVGGFHLGRARAAREPGGRRTTAVVEAVRHAAPAVVSVRAVTVNRRRYRKYNSGSGVLVHSAGFVVTNSHLIAGARSVTVELFNEPARPYPARVVANQPGRDMALLRIDRPGGFPYVSIAPTRSVIRGETAIAIGNPHGLGDTITVGVVSALGRDAKLPNGASLRGLIQTDASINTGNSGGALLNLDGELLGVVVSLLPRSTGIAFAIPGDQVKALLRRALGSAPRAKPLPAAPPPAPAAVPRQASSQRDRAGERDAHEGGRKASGMRTRPLGPGDFGLTLREEGTRSLDVTAVRPASAADLAGVRAGDRVLAIEGRAVACALDVVMAFSAASPGRVYQVRIGRGAREMHVALITPR